MGYEIDAVSADCYEGTSCLINRFGIRDEDKLADIEAAITFAKASELEKNPIEGRFDLVHYLSIHKFLFEDIYGWAGTLRTVDISKMGTDFAKAEEIERLSENCFNRLEKLNYFQNLPFEDFIENIVDLYCVTNMIHPFREGNGRVQRVFISQLVRFNGYDIDFSVINPDDLMIATIQSASGVRDNLLNVFKLIIKK
ncbi:MAG: Fic family protein [Clostridia bacterium]|nr:Fic family protein [Clostridia bacterium]